MSRTNTRLITNSQICVSHNVNAQGCMEGYLSFFNFFCYDYPDCAFPGLKDLTECLLEHDCWS